MFFLCVWKINRHTVLCRFSFNKRFQRTFSHSRLEANIFGVQNWALPKLWEKEGNYRTHDYTQLHYCTNWRREGANYIPEHSWKQVKFQIKTVLRTADDAVDSNNCSDVNIRKCLYSLVSERRREGFAYRIRRARW